MIIINEIKADNTKADFDGIETVNTDSDLRKRIVLRLEQNKDIHILDDEIKRPTLIVLENEKNPSNLIAMIHYTVGYNNENSYYKLETLNISNIKDAFEKAIKIAAKYGLKNCGFVNAKYQEVY